MKNGLHWTCYETELATFLVLEVVTKDVSTKRISVNGRGHAVIKPDNACILA